MQNYTYYKRKISSGKASGKNRAIEAVREAVEKMSNNNKEIFVSITSGSNLIDNEISTITFFLQNKLNIFSNINFDVIINEEINDELQVTIYEVIKNKLDIPEFLKMDKRVSKVTA